MRRYALVLGERERLRAEIRSHIAGSLHNGKPIDGLQAALAALDDGADETTAGDFVYRVTHDGHPSPLSRTDHREGTREELLAELEALRDDVSPGRDDKAALYDEAIAELRSGAAATSLPRTVYLVAHTDD